MGHRCDLTDSVPDADLDESRAAGPTSPPTASSTASCPGWTSTPACSRWPRTAQPLLERLKFLAIFASNLDEFYMVRIAGLKRRADRAWAVLPDGLSPRERLRRSATARGTSSPTRRRFTEDIEPAAERGSGSCTGRPSPTTTVVRLREYFRDQGLPGADPARRRPGAPVPYISGLSLNLAVLVRDPDGGAQLRPGQGAQQRAALRRGLADPTEPEYLPLEELIAAHLPKLFPGHAGRRAPRCSASPATPTSRSRRTATRTCCRHWSASSRAAGSALRCG